jgi:hypothetical protein
MFLSDPLDISLPSIIPAMLHTIYTSRVATIGVYEIKAVRDSAHLTPAIKTEQTTTPLKITNSGRHL